MVFENLMITEPGLKMFSGCQHLRWYAFSNLALHKDVDIKYSWSMKFPVIV